MASFDLTSLQEWFSSYFRSSKTPEQSLTSASKNQDISTSSLSGFHTDDPFSHLMENASVDDLISLSNQLSESNDKTAATNSDSQEELLASIRALIKTKSGLSDTELKFQRQAYLVSPDSTGVTEYTQSLFDAGIINESQSVEDLANAIGSYVQEHINYVEELDQQDVWKQADDTLASGEGDCEDLAILTASVLMNALKKQGYSDMDVRNMVTISAGTLTKNGTDVGHTFVKFSADPNSTRNYMLDPTSGSQAVLASDLSFNELFECNDRIWEVYGHIDESFTTSFEIENLDAYLTQLEDAYNNLYYAADQAEVDVWYYDYDSYMEDTSTALRVYSEADLATLIEENNGVLPEGAAEKTKEEYDEEGLLTVSRSVATIYENVDGEWVQHTILDYFWTVETHALSFDTDDVPVSDASDSDAIVDVQTTATGVTVSVGDLEVSAELTDSNPVTIDDFENLSIDAQDIWDNLLSLGYIDENGNVQTENIDAPLLAEDFDSLGMDDSSPLIEALIEASVLTDDMFITAGLSGDELEQAVKDALSNTAFSEYIDETISILNENNALNPLSNLGDAYDIAYENADGETVKDKNVILEILRDHRPTAETEGMALESENLPAPEEYEDDTESMPENQTLDGDSLQFTTYVLNGDNLYNYINTSRRLINQFSVLYYVILSITEMHIFGTREIQDQGLSYEEQRAAADFRNETDKIRKKLANNIASIQQKTGTGVQDISKELLNVVQVKNKSSYDQAKLDVELFANENIGEGIGSDLVDGFTHALSYVRSRVRAQLTAKFSLAYTNNSVQLAEMTKLYLDGPDTTSSQGSKGDRKVDTGISLWGDVEEYDPEYETITNSAYSTHSDYYGQHMWEVISANASGEPASYDKKNLIFMIDNLKNDANRLQALVEQGLAKGAPDEKSDIFEISKGVVSTEEIATEAGIVTEATQYFEQSRDFNYDTDESTFIDIKMDMFESLRKGIIQFENNVRTALMIKHSILERILEATKDMSGNKETTGVRTVNKATTQALNIEISKLSGSFDSLFSQFIELYSSVNDYASARIEYHKAYRYTVAKNAKNAALLALLASATAAGASIAPIFAITGSFLALPTYWSYAINQVGAAVIEAAYAGWEYHDLGKVTPEWHRPGILQQGDSNDDNIYNHLWTETYAKSKEQEIEELGISTSDALGTLSDDQGSFFANKMMARLVRARSQVNALVSNSDSYGNFNLIYGQGDTNNSETIPDSPVFARNRGDGAVSIEGVDLARTNALYVEQINKMRLILAILKAYYDAIEFGISEMTGMSKRGAGSKFDSQIASFASQEDALIKTVKHEVSIFEQAAKQNYTKDKTLYRQQYDATMASTDIASSVLAFLPPGGRDAAILAKDLATESTRNLVLENFGDYAGQWANYKRSEGEWAYEDFTAIYNSESYMESRESDIASRDADYELYSGDNIFETDIDPETGRASDSSLIQVGEQVLRQTNQSVDGRSNSEKIELARRLGTWYKLEYEEHRAMQKLLNYGTRDAYSDGLEFQEVNYQQLIDSQEELLRISVLRTIVLMIEKSIANAKLSVYKQAFGSATSSGIYDSITSVTDAYNQGQIQLMSDLAQELASRVEAHTTWYSSIINTSVSATGMMAFLGVALGQANSNSGNTFSMRKFFRDNQQQGQRALAKGSSTASSQAIVGSMGMSTLRNSAATSSEILAYDHEEEEEEEELKKKKEKLEQDIQNNGGVATESQQTELNNIDNRLSEIEQNREERGKIDIGQQNLQFTGRGNLSVNRGILNRYQAIFKQKLRFMLLERQAYIALADAVLDNTDEFGGNSSSRAHRELLGIINKYGSNEQNIMNNLYKGVTARSSAFNQAMKFIKLGVTSAATAATNKIIENRILAKKMELKKQKSDAPGPGNAPSDTSYTPEQKKAVKNIQMLEALAYIADPVVFLIFDTILNSGTERAYGMSSTTEEDLSVSGEGVEYGDGDIEASGEFDGSTGSGGSGGFSSANIENEAFSASLVSSNMAVKRDELYGDRETFQFFQRYLQSKIISGFRITDSQSEKFGTGFGKMFGNKRFNKLRKEKLMDYTSGKLDVNNDKAFKAFNESKALTNTHRRFAIKELGFDPTLSPEAQARKVMEGIASYYRTKDAQQFFNVGLVEKEHELMGMDRRLEMMDAYSGFDETIRKLKQDADFAEIQRREARMTAEVLPTDQIIRDLEGMKYATYYALGMHKKRLDQQIDQHSDMSKEDIQSLYHHARVDALFNLLRADINDDDAAHDMAGTLASMADSLDGPKGFSPEFYTKEISNRLTGIIARNEKLQYYLKKINANRSKEAALDDRYLASQIHVLASSNQGTDELLKRHERVTQRLVDLGISPHFLADIEHHVPTGASEKESWAEGSSSDGTGQAVIDDGTAKSLKPRDFLSHYFNHAGLGMNRLMAKKRSLDLIGATVEATRTYALDDEGNQIYGTPTKRRNYKEYADELAKRLEHFGGFSIQFGQHFDALQRDAKEASRLTIGDLSDQYKDYATTIGELKKRVTKGGYTTGRDVDKKGSHHYLDEVTDMASDPDKYGIKLHSGSMARQLDKNPFDNFMGGLAGTTLAVLAIVPSLFAFIGGVVTGMGATKTSRKLFNFAGNVYRDAFTTGFRVSDGARSARLLGKSNEDVDPIVSRDTRYAIQAERRGIMRQKAANALVESVYRSSKHGDTGKARRINKHRGTEFAGQIDGAFKSDFKGNIDKESNYYLEIERVASAVIHRRTGTLEDKAEILLQTLDRLKDPNRAIKVGAQIFQKAASNDPNHAKALADALLTTANLWDEEQGTTKYRAIASKSILASSTFDERSLFNYINKHTQTDGRSAHQNYHLRGHRGPTLAGFASTALGRGESILEGLGIKGKTVGKKQEHGRMLLASLDVQSLEHMSDSITHTDLQSGLLRDAVGQRHIASVTQSISGNNYNAHETQQKLEAYARLLKKAGYSTDTDMPEALRGAFDRLGRHTEELSDTFSRLHNGLGQARATGSLADNNTSISDVAKRLNTDTYSEMVETRETITSRRHFAPTPDVPIEEFDDESSESDYSDSEESEDESITRRHIQARAESEANPLQRPPAEPGIQEDARLIRRRLNRLGLETIFNQSEAIAFSLISATSVDQIQPFLGLLGETDLTSDDARRAIQSLGQELAQYTQSELNHLIRLLDQSASLSESDQNPAALIKQAILFEQQPLQVRRRDQQSRDVSFKINAKQYEQALERLQQLDDKHLLMFLEDANNLQSVSRGIVELFAIENSAAIKTTVALASRLKQTPSLQEKLAGDIAKHIYERQQFIDTGYKRVNIKNLKQSLQEHAKLTQTTKDLASFLAKFDFAYRAQQYLPSLSAFFNATSGISDQQAIIDEYARVYGIDAAGDFLRKAATKDPAAMAFLLSDLNNINPPLSAALANNVANHAHTHDSPADIEALQKFYTALASNSLVFLPTFSFTGLPLRIRQKIGDDKLNGKIPLDLDDMFEIYEHYATVEANHGLTAQEQRLLGYIKLYLASRDGYKQNETRLLSQNNNAYAFGDRAGDLSTKITALATHPLSFKKENNSYKPTSQSKKAFLKLLSDQTSAVNTAVTHMAQRQAHLKNYKFSPEWDTKKQSLDQLQEDLNTLTRALKKQQPTAFDRLNIQSITDRLLKNRHILTPDTQALIRQMTKIMPLLPSSAGHEDVARLMTDIIHTAPASQLVLLLDQPHGKAFIKQIVSSGQDSHETLAIINQLLLVQSSQGLTSMVKERLLKEAIERKRLAGFPDTVWQSLSEVTITDENLALLTDDEQLAIKNQAEASTRAVQSYIELDMASIGKSVASHLFSIAQEGIDDKVAQELLKTSKRIKTSLFNALETNQSQSSTQLSEAFIINTLTSIHQLLAAEASIGDENAIKQNWQTPPLSNQLKTLTTNWKHMSAKLLGTNHPLNTTIDNSDSLEALNQALVTLQSEVNRQSGHTNAQPVDPQILHNLQQVTATATIFYLNKQLEDTIGTQDNTNHSVVGGIETDGHQLNLKPSQVQALQTLVTHSNQPDAAASLLMYKRQHPIAYFRLLATVALHGNRQDITPLKQWLMQHDPDTLTPMLRSPLLFSTVALANSQNHEQGFASTQEISEALALFFGPPRSLNTQPLPPAQTIVAAKVDEMRALSLNMVGLERLVMPYKDTITATDMFNLQEVQAALSVQDTASGFMSSLQSFVNKVSSTSTNFIQKIQILSTKVKSKCLKGMSYQTELGQIFGQLHCHIDELRELGIKEQDILKLGEPFSSNTEQLLATLDVLDTIQHGPNRDKGLASDPSKQALTSTLQQAKSFLSTAVMYEIIGNTDSSVQQKKSTISTFLSMIHRDATRPQSPRLFSEPLTPLFRKPQHLEAWAEVFDMAKPSEKDTLIVEIMNQANIFEPGNKDLLSECLLGLSEQPYTMGQLMSRAQTETQVNILDDMIADPNKKQVGLVLMTKLANPDPVWQQLKALDPSVAHPSLTPEELVEIAINLEPVQKQSFLGFIDLRYPTQSAEIRQSIESFNRINMTGFSVNPETVATPVAVNAESPVNIRIQNAIEKYYEQAQTLSETAQELMAISEFYVGTEHEFDGLAAMSNLESPLKEACFNHHVASIANARHVTQAMTEISSNLPQQKQKLFQAVLAYKMDHQPREVSTFISASLKHPMIRPIVGPSIKNLDATRKIFGRHPMTNQDYLDIETIQDLIEAPQTDALRKTITGVYSAGLPEPVETVLQSFGILDENKTFHPAISSRSALQSRLTRTTRFNQSAIQHIVNHWESQLNGLPLPMLLATVKDHPSLLGSLAPDQTARVIKSLHDQHQLSHVSRQLIGQLAVIRDLVATGVSQGPRSPERRLAVDIINQCGHSPKTLAHVMQHGMQAIDTMVPEANKADAMASFISQTIGHPSFLEFAPFKHQHIQTISHECLDVTALSLTTKQAVERAFTLLANADAKKNKFDSRTEATAISKTTKLSIGRALLERGLGGDDAAEKLSAASVMSVLKHSQKIPVHLSNYRATLGQVNNRLAVIDGLNKLAVARPHMFKQLSQHPAIMPILSEAYVPESLSEHQLTLALETIAEKFSHDPEHQLKNTSDFIRSIGAPQLASVWHQHLITNGSLTPNEEGYILTPTCDIHTIISGFFTSLLQLNGIPHENRNIDDLGEVLTEEEQNIGRALFDELIQTPHVRHIVGALGQTRLLELSMKSVAMNTDPNPYRVVDHVVDNMNYESAKHIRASFSKTHLTETFGLHLVSRAHQSESELLENENLIYCVQTLYDTQLLTGAGFLSPHFIGLNGKIDIEKLDTAIATNLNIDEHPNKQALIEDVKAEIKLSMIGAECIHLFDGTHNPSVATSIAEIADSFSLSESEKHTLNDIIQPCIDCVQQTDEEIMEDLETLAPEPLQDIYAQINHNCQEAKAVLNGQPTAEARRKLQHIAITLENLAAQSPEPLSRSLTQEIETFAHFAIDESMISANEVLKELYVGRHQQNMLKLDTELGHLYSNSRARMHVLQGLAYGDGESEQFSPLSWQHGHIIDALTYVKPGDTRSRLDQLMTGIDTDPSASSQIRRPKKGPMDALETDVQEAIAKDTLIENLWTECKKIPLADIAASPSNFIKKIEVLAPYLSSDKLEALVNLLTRSVDQWTGEHVKMVQSIGKSQVLTRLEANHPNLRFNILKTIMKANEGRNQIDCLETLQSSLKHETDDEGNVIKYHQLFGQLLHESILTNKDRYLTKRSVERLYLKDLIRDDLIGGPSLLLDPTIVMANTQGVIASGLDAVMKSRESGTLTRRRRTTEFQDSFFETYEGAVRTGNVMLIKPFTTVIGKHSQSSHDLSWFFEKISQQTSIYKPGSGKEESRIQPVNMDGVPPEQQKIWEKILTNTTSISEGRGTFSAGSTLPRQVAVSVNDAIQETPVVSESGEVLKRIDTRITKENIAKWAIRSRVFVNDREIDEILDVINQPEQEQEEEQKQDLRQRITLGCQRALSSRPETQQRALIVGLIDQIDQSNKLSNRVNKALAQEAVPLFDVEIEAPVETNGVNEHRNYAKIKSLDNDPDIQSIPMGARTTTNAVVRELTSVDIGSVIGVIKENHLLIDGQLTFPLPDSIQDVDWKDLTLSDEAKKWVLTKLKRKNESLTEMLKSLNRDVPHVLYRFDNKVQKAKHQQIESGDTYHNPYKQKAAIGIHQKGRQALLPYLVKHESQHRHNIESRLVSIMRDRQKITEKKFMSTASSYGKSALVTPEVAKAVYIKLMASDVVDSNGIVIPRKVEATYLTRLIGKVKIKDIMGNVIRTETLNSRQINKIKGALHDLLEESFAVKDRILSRSHDEHMAYLSNPAVTSNDKAFYVRTLMLKPAADSSSYTVSDTKQRAVSKALVEQTMLEAEKVKDELSTLNLLDDYNNLKQKISATDLEKIKAKKQDLLKREETLKETLLLFYIEDRHNTMKWLHAHRRQSVFQRLGLDFIQPELRSTGSGAEPNAHARRRTVNASLTDDVSEWAASLQLIQQNNPNKNEFQLALRWWITEKNISLLEITVALNILAKQGKSNPRLIQNVVDTYTRYPEILIREMCGISLDGPIRKQDIQLKPRHHDLEMACQFIETETYYKAIETLKINIQQGLVQEFVSQASLLTSSDTDEDAFNKIKKIANNLTTESSGHSSGQYDDVRQKKRSQTHKQAIDRQQALAARQAHATYKKDGKFVHFLQRLVEATTRPESTVFQHGAYAANKRQGDADGLENIQWLVPGDVSITNDDGSQTIVPIGALDEANITYTPTSG